MLLPKNSLILNKYEETLALRLRADTLQSEPIMTSLSHKIISSSLPMKKMPIIDHRHLAQTFLVF